MMHGWAGHGAYSWEWGGMLLGMLVPLVLLGLGIWVVVSLTARAGRSEKQTPAAALEILEQRFARGEISADEFRTMRQELTRP